MPPPPPGAPWDLPLGECPLAFLDCEMTGLDLARDALIEVAITRTVGGAVVASLDTCVRTHVESRPDALAAHGIDTASLADAPELHEVSARAAELLRGAVPVAHGVEMDAAFLNRAFELAGEDLRLDAALDTLTLARRCLHASTYSLAALAERLDLGAFRWHRAGEDVRALRALFDRLVALYAPVSARDLWEVRVGQRGPVSVRASIARELDALASRRAFAELWLRSPGRELMRLTGRVERWSPPHVTLTDLGPQRHGVRIVRADRVIRVEPASE